MKEREWAAENRAKIGTTRHTAPLHPRARRERRVAPNSGWASAEERWE